MASGQTKRDQLERTIAFYEEQLKNNNYSRDDKKNIKIDIEKLTRELKKVKRNISENVNKCKRCKGKTQTGADCRKNTCNQNGLCHLHQKQERA